MGTQGVGPPGLLSMPGFSLKDSAPVNFRKSHLFDIQGGIPVVKDGPSVAVKLPQPSATQNSSVEVDEAAVAASDTTPGTPAPMLPSWLAYDRKVLRFNCHFKESVQESRLENFRIRNFVIYYYLEDDTMHVSEPKVENSGLLQGEHKGTVFLKRHRIPKSDGSMFTHADLNVGVEVQLYGRAYLITDADPFTREFLEASGVTVGDGISVPQDQYATAREEMKSLVVQNQKYFHPRPADDEMIRSMEATLGRSSTVLEGDKLSQFLKNDRKVLRFYVAWDDRKSLYGELRAFVLHYFLADNTIEMREVRRANSGRDPFPLYLKRGKVYKKLDSYLNINAPTTHTTQLIDRTGRVDPGTMEVFTETDFAVGKEIHVNGSDLLIHGCDEFTREYYEKVHGVRFDDIPMKFE